MQDGSLQEERKLMLEQTHRQMHEQGKLQAWQEEHVMNLRWGDNMECIQVRASACAQAKATTYRERAEAGAGTRKNY